MTYFMRFVAACVHMRQRAPHACAATVVATRKRPLPYHEDVTAVAGWEQKYDSSRQTAVGDETTVTKDTIQQYNSSAASLLSPTSVRFSRVFLYLLFGAYDPT